jgi:hypothetical protein
MKTRRCLSSRMEEASPTLLLARLKVKVFTAGVLGPYTPDSCFQPRRPANRLIAL